MLTTLSRYKLHLKRKHVYGLGMCILLLIAFIAGGISMNSVSAANSNLKEPAKGVGKGNLQKDGLMVTGVSGHTISGKHKDGTTVKVITTASTTFTKDGVSVSLSAVKVGEFIGVVGSASGAGSITATHVEILATENSGPRGDSATATITSITGTTITIQGSKGSNTSTINTTATTHFASKITGHDVTLGSLKVGDFVLEEGNLKSDGSLTAAAVIAGAPPSSDYGDQKGPKGTTGDSAVGRITAIYGTTITIQDFKGGNASMIRTTATTQFFSKIAGHDMTLGSLKVGDFVYVGGKLNSDGSLTVKFVVVGVAPN